MQWSQRSQEFRGRVNGVGPATKMGSTCWGHLSAAGGFIYFYKKLHGSDLAKEVGQALHPSHIHLPTWATTDPNVPFYFLASLHILT